MILREEVARAGSGLRFALGALSLVLGITWILLNLHSASVRLDLLIGAVLAAGGLVLLMPHRISLPPRGTAIAMTGTALAGTAAGLVVSKSQLCCMFAFIVDRGWPFTWATKGAVADDPDVATRLADSAGWSANFLPLAADLLLFSYVGLLLTVIYVLVRRARLQKRP
ncbi:hypothetical protein AB0J83_10215 [Actinoplanes sp. NPDC049596]|uniref:hypothetical protein n=1 Tax=unclassified Actinoplanes TaxID=2626549 RepID=UPI0034403A1D